MILQGVRDQYSVKSQSVAKQSRQQEEQLRKAARRCQLVLIGKHLNAQQVATTYEAVTGRAIRWLGPVRGEPPSAATAALRLITLAGLVALVLAPEAAAASLDAVWPGAATLLFQWRWFLLTVAALLFGGRHLIRAILEKDDD